LGDVNVNKADAQEPLDVTVLYTAGCGGTPATIALVKRVAHELDIPLRLQEVLIHSPEQAVRQNFLGSPTVQVNGLDIDPAARQRDDYGFM
jgi:hypothetical protein